MGNDTSSFELWSKLKRESSWGLFLAAAQQHQIHIQVMSLSLHFRLWQSHAFSYISPSLLAAVLQVFFCLHLIQNTTNNLLPSFHLISVCLKLSRLPVRDYTTSRAIGFSVLGTLLWPLNCWPLPPLSNCNPCWLFQLPANYLFDFVFQCTCFCMFISYDGISLHWFGFKYKAMRTVTLHNSKS